MNWAPPSDTPEPAIDPGPPTGASDTESERRRLSAVPAAAWVALLGSSLLLTAAIAVVASNWDTIGRSARFAGLLAVLVGLLIAAERLRQLVPTSASIIAHAGTYLSASVGIAALSMLGITWPRCLLAGGIALIVATELQATRWRRATMHIAQVAGWAIAATGAAALLGTTAGLIAMITSVGLLIAGAHRRSVALAVLAVLSPAVAAFAEVGVGAGTLTRAGLVGQRLGWSGPAVGLLAATVIGAIALQRRSNPLVLIAAASPVVGIITGLAAAHGSSVAWWSVPALALIAAELGLWLLPTDRHRTRIADVVDVVAATVAGIAWLTPAIASVELADAELTSPWVIPITITALAVALSILRWKGTGSNLAELGIASLAANLIGITVAFDAPTHVIAAAGVLAAAVSAIGSRRLSPVAIYPTTLWALIGIARLAATNRSWGTAVAVMLMSLVVTIVVASRARLASDNRLVGWLEMGGVVAGASITTMALFDDAEPAIGLATAAIVVCLTVLVEQRMSIWGVSAIGTAALFALAAATATGSLDPTYWLGLATSATVLALLWLVGRSSWHAAAAAAAAVFTTAAATVQFGIPSTDFIVMAMLVVTALTGVAAIVERRVELDAAAIAAGVVLLATTALDVHPGWISAVWLVIGMQIFVAGVTLGVSIVRWYGASTAAGALVSWWFTSGFQDWLLSAIEPADIRVGDLWLGAATLAALAAGLALRAAFELNTWLAYGAALAISGLWLTSTHIDRGAMWVLPLLGTIGVIAAVLGAWHRLAAPLLGGTMLTIDATLLAVGGDLTAVPTWTWLALGGGALLSTAVLIERTGRPGTPELRALMSRWQ